MNLELNDKVVVVTGGTGHIGAEIIKTFIEEGSKVIFFYKKADKKAAELIEKHGNDRCKGYKLDLLNQAELAEKVAEIIAEEKKIDILINNAALTDVMPFPLIEDEDWDELMDVNVKATFIATKEIARYMIKAKEGAIINMGSLAGERIMEVPVHYATSKSAIRGFTFSLTKELSRFNIRVNCVVPGLIDGGVGNNITDKQKNQYIEFNASQRLGKASEVANLVVYLSSSKSSYINGQIIHIDGGI